MAIVGCCGCCFSLCRRNCRFDCHALTLHPHPVSHVSSGSNNKGHPSGTNEYREVGSRGQREVDWPISGSGAEWQRLREPNPDLCSSERRRTAQSTDQSAVRTRFTWLR